MLALFAIVGNIADVVMKLELNDKLPPEERFSWWSRSYWKVERKYKDLNPDSYLPLIARLSFWLTLAMLATMVVVGKWDR